MNCAPPKPEVPRFIRKEFELAAHIRDPDHSPAPREFEERRIKIYRELFYNNIEGFLSGSFPVLRSITPDARWHAMVRDFFIKHRCQTPLFPQFSHEFLAYLQTERGCQEGDPPFLLELAHYEWVELALGIAEEEVSLVSADPNADLLSGEPVLSPLAWVLSYRYPVHRIAPEFQPEQPPEQPTHLLVYRDRQDKIGFLELNPATHRLLQLLGEPSGRSGLEILEEIAAEIDHPRPETLVEGGKQILEQLRNRDAIIGARHPSG
jgi:hypothetical protein